MVEVSTNPLSTNGKGNGPVSWVVDKTVRIPGLTECPESLVSFLSIKRRDMELFVGLMFALKSCLLDLVVCK